MDAGSPRRVRRAIDELLAGRGFRLLRSDGFLSPNAARNLGLRASEGRYVVFIDKDVLVSPGWLERLVACAEETGADLVGPLYLHGPPARGVIHMAGGEARIEERGGRRVLHERHRRAGGRLAELAASFRREPCELLEFHCMLARRSLFDRVGMLDEALLSLHEHIDLCLLARESGGTVWFEPTSVVAYVPPPPFERGDRPFYLLRWSRDWNGKSIRHFAHKWRLDDTAQDVRRQLACFDDHRRVAVRETVEWLGGRYWRRYGDWLTNGLDWFLERLVIPRA